MNLPRLLVVLAMALPMPYVQAQVSITMDDRLPPACVELRAKEPLATDTPWQLPKPGDAHYDDAQEALVKDTERTHVARLYERGVFVGYGTISADPKKDGLAEKQRSQFAHNPGLADDAVELTSESRPDRSEYFQKLPDKRPPNVPANCIPVRVYQGKELIGWTYMAKEDVAMLHQPE